MNLFIKLSCFFILVFASVSEAVPSSVEVRIESAQCDSEFCVAVSVFNRGKNPICIENSYLPYNGNLYENVFSIINKETKTKANFDVIEPSFIVDPKLAILVRLIPPGATAMSHIDLDTFYTLERGKKYRAEYVATAFKCHRFGKKSGKLLLNAHIFL